MLVVEEADLNLELNKLLFIFYSSIIMEITLQEKLVRFVKQTR